MDLIGYMLVNSLTIYHLWVCVLCGMCTSMHMCKGIFLWVFLHRERNSDALFAPSLSYLFPLSLELGWFPTGPKAFLSFHSPGDNRHEQLNSQVLMWVFTSELRSSWRPFSHTSISPVLSLWNEYTLARRDLFRCLKTTQNLKFNTDFNLTICYCSFFKSCFFKRWKHLYYFLIHSSNATRLPCSSSSTVEKSGK